MFEQSLLQCEEVELEAAEATDEFDVSAYVSFETRPLSFELNEHLAAVSAEVASDDAADEEEEEEVHGGGSLRRTRKGASSGLELASPPLAKSSMSSMSSA